MFVAQHSGRLALLRVPSDAGGETVTCLDVATASGGRFGPDPMGIYADWAAFVASTETLDWTAAASVAVRELGPPVPRPRQVFAAGANYGERATEGGMDIPKFPPIFTKYVSSLAGPSGELKLQSDTVDWEVELVVVLAHDVYMVSESEASDAIAGAMVGQDITDRGTQFQGQYPQFSLSKSQPGFSPTGPWLATLDELDGLDDLRIGCSLNDEVMQDGSTSQMLMSPSRLISELSQRAQLLAGDLVFTGTPGGVGHYRTPPRHLRPGDVLTSSIAGLGSQTLRVVSERSS